MTHLLSALCAVCALAVRHLLCMHRVRETRPSTLVGPGGEQLLDVRCPKCRTAWTEYPK